MRNTKVFKDYVLIIKIIGHLVRAKFTLRLKKILNKEDKILLVKYDIFMVLESCKELQDRHTLDEEESKLIEGCIQDFEYVLNNI